MMTVVMRGVAYGDLTMTAWLGGGGGGVDGARGEVAEQDEVMYCQKASPVHSP